MSDPLSPENLMAHVRALADDIGPRPTGTDREQQAHDYVRSQLTEMGLDDIEVLRFQVAKSWGFGLWAPFATALVGNLLPLGRFGRFIGSMLSGTALFAYWRVMRVMPHPFDKLNPNTGSSSNQTVRVPAASGKPKHKLVFIGHVDSNRHRATFSPTAKKMLTFNGTLALIVLTINTLVQVVRLLGRKDALSPLRWGSLLTLLYGLAVVLWDEQGDFVDGANDNASAVACLLGLAAHFKANPLPETEVWFAFTGAEESGCYGIRQLLNAHGRELEDAFFLDFEVVGAGRLAYVTRHSSFSAFTRYIPDPDSALMSARIARLHPELEVTGRPMVITEEIAVLRNQGYRGLCLVGYDPVDGFLPNWHRESDNTQNIDPDVLARAAQFGKIFAEAVDQRPA